MVDLRKFKERDYWIDLSLPFTGWREVPYFPRTDCDMVVVVGLWMIHDLNLRPMQTEPLDEYLSLR